MKTRQKMLLFLGVLFSFSHAKMPLDNTQSMIKKLIDKVEGMNSDIKQIKDTIIAMKEGCQSQLKNIDATLVEFIGSEVKLAAESLKEDISDPEDGCQSHLESINATFVDLVDNDNETGKNQHQHKLFPVDCKEVFSNGRSQNGVYTIFPACMPDGLDVYCDQESDGGGWTVFLQRQEQTPQVDFVRPFEDYAAGFGQPGREFWLGNRGLHAMTGRRPYILRVEATSIEGESRHGTWGTFSVASEKTQFKLLVNDYERSSSTLGDGMSKGGSPFQSNGMRFATHDMDHNGCSSGSGRAGWWYDGCYGVKATAPATGTGRSGLLPLNWYYWEKDGTMDYTYLSRIQFKVRPR